MVIDTAKLKISTKRLFAFFLCFGGLMQIPTVSGFVGSVTLHHPHVAALVTAVTGIALLLHNPEVQDVLGIKTTHVLTETSEKITLVKDAQ